MGLLLAWVKGAARCTGSLWTSSGPVILATMHKLASSSGLATSPQSAFQAHLGGGIQVLRMALFWCSGRCPSFAGRLVVIAALLVVVSACSSSDGSGASELVEGSISKATTPAGAKKTGPRGRHSAEGETSSVPAVAGANAPVSRQDCAGIDQFRGQDVALVEIERGFARPVHLSFVPGSKGAFVVLEQAGLARIGRPGGLWREFLDLREVVSSEGEQGLLSLAFHPRYESNGRLFAYYTVGAGDVILSEFQVAGAGASVRVDRGTEKTLLRIDQRFSNHFAGQLLFGRDGFLYVGIGDGGSEGDPDNNAQRFDSLLGKILRIDVDSVTTERPYGIPGDNPFVNRDGARGEIWALGLRNPWRFSFDKETGRMWISDVGGLQWEELSLGVVGGNYGWKILEGTHCFETGCDRDYPGLVAPIWEYGRDRGMSVIGGFVYRGCSLPDLRGLYFFSDYSPPDSPLWSLQLKGESISPGSVALESTGAVISSFGEGADGELYALDHLAGRLLKLKGKGL
jgi:glucose/arabinose dehydrogenase